MQHYFTNSEQSVVHVETAIGQREENGEAIWCAAGLMVQQVPKQGGKNSEEEQSASALASPEDIEEDWNHNRILVGTVKDEELLDIYLSPPCLRFDR